MTKVINLRKRYKPIVKTIVKSNIKSQRNKLTITEIYKTIFTIICIISLLSGCIIYRFYPVNEITNICENFISNLLKSTFIEIFFCFLKLDLIYYLLIFYIGTSVVGVPLTFIPIFLKSVYIGYLSSFMYCEYELKGTLFCLVLLYPYFVITTTSLIYASNESVYMCKYLYNTLTNKNTADNISIRLYLIRYLFLIVINIACIVVNSLLILVLGNKFNLM